MREDDRPDRWDDPDPDRPDGPDRLDSRDRPEIYEHERIVEEREVGRTTEWEYEEPPPPIGTDVSVRAPPPRPYRWVGAPIIAANGKIAAMVGIDAIGITVKSPRSSENRL